MVSSSDPHVSLEIQAATVEALVQELKLLPKDTPAYASKENALDSASREWKRLQIAAKSTSKTLSRQTLTKTYHQQTLGETIDLVNPPKSPISTRSRSSKRARSLSPTLLTISAPPPVQSPSSSRMTSTALVSLKKTKPSSCPKISSFHSRSKHSKPSKTKQTKDSRHTSTSPTRSTSNRRSTSSAVQTRSKTTSTHSATNPLTPSHPSVPLPSNIPPPSNNSNPPPTSLSYAAAATAPSPSVSKNPHQLRFRFNVPGFLPKGSTRVDGCREVLSRILKTLHNTDATAAILPWNQNHDAKLPPIPPNPSTLIPKTNCLEYISSPNKSTYLQNKEQAFRQGIRISSNLPLRVFIDTWNIARKTTPGSYVLSPAETQTHFSASLVGFCQGSTEKKDFSILRRELPKLTGIAHLDLSWQTISLGRHNRELWNEANETATRILDSAEPTSQWKQKKFAHSPRALAIFAPTSAEASTARRILYQTYGKSDTGQFPQWPDGSRMKFLPLDDGFLPSNIADRILPRLRWHIFAKANEIAVPLPELDPWKEIGDSGESIGSFLHGVTTPKGTPIFRHITHRWTPHPEETQWNITASAHMDDVAHQYISNLSKHLRTKFGDEALSAFCDFGAPTGTSKPQSDLGQYYESLNDDLVQENLLEPGFATVIFDHDMKKFGGIDSDSTFGQPSSAPPYSDTTTIPSMDSPSVSTHASKSVQFDEVGAQQSLKERDNDKVASILKQFKTTSDQFQSLQHTESAIWGFASNSTDTHWKAVTYFLRNMKKLNKLNSTPITGAAEADRSPDTTK